MRERAIDNNRLKKYFLGLLFIFFTHLSVKADSIDYFHVFYNKSLIRDGFRQMQDIVIKTDSVQTGDSISVRYYTDTPCQDCPLLLSSTDDPKKGFYLSGHGMGTGNPVSVSVAELLSISKKTGNKQFLFFFTEYPWIRQLQLFSIRFE